MSRQTTFQHSSVDFDSRNHFRSFSQHGSSAPHNANTSHTKPTSPRQQPLAGYPETMRNSGGNGRQGNTLNFQSPSSAFQRERLSSQNVMHHLQSHHHSLPTQQVSARVTPSSSRYSTMPTIQTSSSQSRQRQNGVQSPSQVYSPHYQANDFLFPGVVTNSSSPFGDQALGDWNANSNGMLSQRAAFNDFDQGGSVMGGMSGNEFSDVPLIQLPAAGSHQWSDMSSFWPAMNSVTTTGPSISTSGRRASSFDAPFTLSPLSTCSSPQSSASHSPHPHSSRNSSPLSAPDSASSPSRTSSPPVPISPSSPSEGMKMCSHCKATSTPLWRRDPQTLKQLCNACGLYLQQRHKLRPQELIDADVDDDTEEDLSTDWTGPECTHCRTRNTSVWRRSKEGAQLCNACGVYRRLRGKDRPLKLKRNKIKPRSKHNLT